MTMGSSYDTPWSAAESAVGCCAVPLAGSKLAPTETALGVRKGYDLVDDRPLLAEEGAGEAGVVLLGVFLCCVFVGVVAGWFC